MAAAIATASVGCADRATDPPPPDTGTAVGVRGEEPYTATAAGRPPTESPAADGGEVDRIPIPPSGSVPPRSVRDTPPPARTHVSADGVELWTDLEGDAVRAEVETLAELRRAWERLPAGSRPENRHLTGFLVNDPERFAAGTFPPEGPPAAGRGWQRGQRFFVRHTSDDRWRHLLRHEAFHADSIGGFGLEAEPWFLEGTAELFALHRFEADGSLMVGTVPDNPEEFAGWTRMKSLRRDLAAGHLPTLAEIRSWPIEAFEADARLYGWAWAAALFLDGDPRTRERFRGLFASRSADDFAGRFDTAFGDELDALARTWPAFAATLDYGLDPAAVAIELMPGEPLGGEPIVREIFADRGWQGTGVRVAAGEPVRIETKGRFTLADVPKPWVSTANGVSIRYFDGRPLGRLVAAIDDGTPGGFLDVIDVGGSAEIVPSRGGDLYLRLGDDWTELGDNRGAVTIILQPAAARSAQGKPEAP